MSEPRDPQQRTWAEWWRLMNSTPWQDAIRGRLTGTLPAVRGVHQWLRREWPRSVDRVESVLAESRLPEPMQAAVRRIVRVARVGRKRKAEFAAELVRGMSSAYFVAPATDGPTERMLTQSPAVETSSLALPLPALERLGDARVCLAHSLPRPISQLIENIVQRTRLWRRERIDVARELIAHFEDGVRAGRESAELIATFGEQHAAARLIRRAKLRQRPWAWRVSRRMLQVLGVCAAILVVGWSWLLVRFLSATPTIQRDFVGEWDRRSQAVAESDRAWPHYRQALMKFHKLNLSGETPGERTAQAQSLEDGVGSEHWSLWQQHLADNREALELTFRGAEKRQLGFLYRDESNREWMESTGVAAFQQHQKCANGILMGVLLPHIQELRSLQLLLAVEVEQARSERDRVRWLRAWSANLSLAEQLPAECGIIQLTAFFYAGQSWSWLRSVLANDPAFLTDDDLRQLAHRIAVFQGGGRLRMKLDREFGDDLLQRFYTDDGHEDGRPTRDYFQLVANVEQMFGKQAAASQASRLERVLKESALSGAIASRAEMQQALRQFYDLEGAESSKPLWEQDLNEPSPGQHLVHQWSRSRWQRLRMMPFLSFMPTSSQAETPNPLRPWQVAEYATQNRDATLTAIALTVFHRRQGEWPQRLEQLCPDQLPDVPQDRFSGQPLRYRIVAGQPLLYSVGRNRIDESGQPPTNNRNGPEVQDGDWRLWGRPPR